MICGGCIVGAEEGSSRVVKAALSHYSSSQLMGRVEELVLAVASTRPWLPFRTLCMKRR